MRRLLDAARFALAILTAPLSRLSVRARGDESRRSLPGDELLPDAPVRCTHAVTIRARAADIWPWLAQMGCDRAGWYSYDGLDNASRPSADEIMPALQRVAVGDILPWAPNDREGFIVRAVEPRQTLVLGGTPPPYDVSWAFVLEPVDESNTRLIVRGRVAPRRARVHLLAPAGLLIHFAMQRRQLLNIRQRAEANPPTVAATT